MVAIRPIRLPAFCQLTAPLQDSEAWMLTDGARVAAVALGIATTTAMAQRKATGFNTSPFWGGLRPTIVFLLPTVNSSVDGSGLVTPDLVPRLAHRPIRAGGMPGSFAPCEATS